MTAMGIWDYHRLGVDVLVVWVPSADIEIVAAGGMTVLLAIGFDLVISLIRGVSTYEVLTGGVSMEAFSWSMLQHLIMNLSRPRLNVDVQHQVVQNDKPKQ